MNNKLRYLLTFFGLYSICVGIWYSFQTIVILNESNYPLNFVNLIRILWAVGYIVSGIGIFRHWKWTEYVFSLLMIALLYKGILNATDFIYRLKLGHIFTLWHEILAGIFLSFYFLLPLLAVWYFVLKKLSKRRK